MPTTDLDFTPIALALDGFIEGALKNVYVLKDVGLELLAGISVMILVWTTIKTLLEGGSPRKMFAHAIFVGMMASFAVFMISELPRLVVIANATTDEIIKKINPGMMPVSSGDSSSKLALQAVSPLLDIAYGIFESESPKVKKKDDGTYETPKESAGILSLLASLGDFSLGLIMLLFSWILKVLVVGTLMIAAFIAMGHFLVSQILIYIAIMIAPIFIPFLVWDAASFMFDGWIKFFIKAMFHKVVGVIMLTIMSSGIKAAFLAIAAAGGIESYGHGEEFRLTGLFAIMALAIVTIYLANQIPTIADGLISGMARTGISFSPGSPRGTGLPKSDKSKADKTDVAKTDSPPSPSKDGGDLGKGKPQGAGPGTSAAADRDAKPLSQQSSFNRPTGTAPSSSSGSFGGGAGPSAGGGAGAGPTV